jgi:hypothetical protein
MPFLSLYESTSVVIHICGLGDWSNKLVNAGERGELEVNILREGPAYGSLSIVNLVIRLLLSSLDVVLGCCGLILEPLGLFAKYTSQ